MSEYNIYGELYDQRPELIIHDRLRHSGTVQNLVKLAQEQNYNVYFSKGPIRQDAIIKWNDDEARRPESHTINSALKVIGNGRCQ